MKTKQNAVSVAVASTIAAPRKAVVIAAQEFAAELALAVNVEHSAKQEHMAQTDVASADAMTSIMHTRTTSADTGAYLTQCALVFGNGLKGKAHEPGLLKGLLADLTINEQVIRTFLTYARKVALWLADPVNLKTAQDLGDECKLRTLYKLAKGETTPAERAPAQVDGADPSQVQSIEQMIARFGLAATVAACARIMEASADTKLAGQTLNAIVAQLVPLKAAK